MMPELKTIVNHRYFSKSVIGALLVVLAVVIFPTIAEFLVALHNRYQNYPLGTDTNMLGLAFLVELVLVFIMMLAIWRWLFGLVWSWTIFWTILTTIVVWILVVGASFPSMLPQSWCKYELRIYSCEQFEMNTQWTNNGIL